MKGSSKDAEIKTSVQSQVWSNIKEQELWSWTDLNPSSTIWSLLFNFHILQFYVVKWIKYLPFRTLGIKWKYLQGM